MGSLLLLAEHGCYRKGWRGASLYPLRSSLREQQLKSWLCQRVLVEGTPMPSPWKCSEGVCWGKTQVGRTECRDVVGRLRGFCRSLSPVAALQLHSRNFCATKCCNVSAASITPWQWTWRAYLQPKGAGLPITVLPPSAPCWMQQGAHIPALPWLTDICT